MAAHRPLLTHPPHPSSPFLPPPSQADWTTCPCPDRFLILASAPLHIWFSLIPTPPHTPFLFSPISSEKLACRPQPGELIPSGSPGPRDLPLFPTVVSGWDSLCLPSPPLGMELHPGRILCAWPSLPVAPAPVWGLAWNRRKAMCKEEGWGSVGPGLQPSSSAPSGQVFRLPGQGQR